ncbi:GntR family transcriptional regulator [Actinomadura physcomitrii]|uniref:GntR family transcriptional regulator n=1 Tax=Actinomadura physcomitrii TaxID=2650748 RepID=UPI0013702B9C|nr:GntR family transcriptional regulator [Actinomadura physcomitrii]
MEFDLDQPRAAYEVIADTIAAEIGAGRLRPGQRVPSAREIATDAGVGMRTAEAALRLLRERGLTVAVVGKATYVAEPSAGASPSDADGE